MATFRIDQAGGAGTGVAGRSRVDLIPGHVIQLVATEPVGGGVTYAWEIIDKVNCTASLTSTTGSSTAIGSSGGQITEFSIFVVRLTATSGSTVTRATRIVAIPDTVTGMRPPGFGESAPSSQTLTTNDPNLSIDNASYANRSGLGATAQNPFGWREAMWDWCRNLNQAVRDIEAMSEVQAVLESNFSEVFYPEDYGAVGDGVADDILALEATVAAVKTRGSDGGRIEFRSPRYRCSRAWRIDHPVFIAGRYGSGDHARTQFIFDIGSNGIIFDGPTTSVSGGTSQWSVLSDVGLSSLGNGGRVPIGIVIRSRAVIIRPYINGFGDGIDIIDGDYAWSTSRDARSGDLCSANTHTYVCRNSGITASSGTGPSGTGAGIITDGTATWQYVNPDTINANHVEVYNPRIANSTRYGMYTHGGNANTAVVYHPDIVGGQIGLLDESFFGVLWFKPEISDCTVRPFANNLSGLNFNQYDCCWFKPYTEGGQPPSWISAPATYIPGIGGDNVEGTTPPVWDYQTTANVMVEQGARQWTIEGDAISGDSRISAFRAGGVKGAVDGAFFSLYPGDTAGNPFKFKFGHRFLENHVSLSAFDADGYHAWGFPSLTGKNGNRNPVYGTFTFGGGHGFYVGSKRVMYMDALPTGDGPWGQGKWWDFYNGDTIVLPGNAPGAAEGAFIAVDGTGGTYTEGRTATANGTTSVVLSAATTIITRGNWLVINSTAARVSAISTDGLTLTMSATIPAGSGLAIAYRPPTFRPFGWVRGGALDMGTQKITSLAAPTAGSTDASTALYSETVATAAAAANPRVVRTTTVRKVTGTTSSTIATTDWALLIDMSGGAHTTTLPLLSTINGYSFDVQKIDTGANTWTLALDGADTSAKIYFRNNAPVAGANLTPVDSTSGDRPSWTIRVAGGDVYLS